jgi:hypothetical protein
MEERNLNKNLGISILLSIFASILTRTVAAVNSPGPAPNSGDGIPDGSGFEPTNFPIELTIILVLLLIGLLLIFFLLKKRKKK